MRAAWHPDDTTASGIAECNVGEAGYWGLDLVRAEGATASRMRIYSVNEYGQRDGVVKRTIRVPDQPSATLSCIAEALPVDEPAR